MARKTETPSARVLQASLVACRALIETIVSLDTQTTAQLDAYVPKETALVHNEVEQLDAIARYAVRVLPALRAREAKIVAQIAALPVEAETPAPKAARKPKKAEATPVVETLVETATA